MASEIRVDKINSLSGVGTVTLSPTGVDIAGITTVATLKATTGIVTTLTATTGIVTTLTANTVTSLGAVSGTTGTFSAAVSGTTGTFSSDVKSTAGIVDIRSGSSINTNVTGGSASGTLQKNTTSGEFAIVSGGSGGNNYLTFHTSASAAPTEKLRIDSSGRVLIGSTAKAGDSALQVYTSDQLHPAIRIHSPNANGFTMFGDAYQTDESNMNIGISYSSASLVISQGCKVSTSADNAYVSSQDTYSTKPNVFRISTDGSFSFLNTNTSATTTTDSAVSLTERLRIRSDGKVLIGASASTSATFNVQGNAVFDDGTNARITLQADGTSTNQILSTTTNFGSYCNMKYQATNHIFLYGGTERARVRSDGGITFGGDTADANALDDYEEGTWTPVWAAGGSASGLANIANCEYVKIGELVHVRGEFSLTGTSGSVTTVDGWYITGLPFPNTDASGSAGTWWMSSSWASGTRATGIVMSYGTNILYFGTEYASGMGRLTNVRHFACTYRTN